ncbi:MAG: regulatory protein RecX [Gilvibacter sp.]
MNPNTTFTVDEAKAKLEAYCAYQERCYKEVREKLRQMKMIPQAQDMIIQHLTKHDYLNETRFAEAFARGKFRVKKWGRQRITRELKLRQLSAYNIKKGLQQISESEYLTTFYELSQKRLDQLTETNKYKKRKKLADYLLYRGWESSLVYSRVTELIP